ncbi:hypothetical protein [Roseibium litorale]|uniref:Uncharacterized protein n=1 Tax=Roseibium litorale TaxID=2803841 RepID=A0ABR9CUY3_9HYPH|nr:hypothetical protein [Roseibium litorale]MBD8894027.1 hypothetical protein [Roseibium litorale]
MTETVRKPQAENADPLRLTASKVERKKEASRRMGYQRGAYLEWLYNKHIIGEAQYLAGCRVRALFVERQGYSKSLDLVNPRVDGGKIDRDFLLVATTDAERMLKVLSTKLGQDQTFVVFCVLGLGFSIQEVAAHFVDQGKEGKSEKVDKATKDYCGRLFRDGLNHAAFFFGYAVAAARSTRGLNLPIHR